MIEYGILVDSSLILQSVFSHRSQISRKIEKNLESIKICMKLTHLAAHFSTSFLYSGLAWKKKQNNNWRKFIFIIYHRWIILFFKQFINCTEIVKKRNTINTLTSAAKFRPSRVRPGEEASSAPWKFEFNIICKIRSPTCLKKNHKEANENPIQKWAGKRLLAPRARSESRPLTVLRGGSPIIRSEFRLLLTSFLLARRFENWNCDPIVIVRRVHSALSYCKSTTNRVLVFFPSFWL